MAKVFPAPVSPVISQPRQKSFRFQLNPPTDAVVWRNFNEAGQNKN